MASTADGGTEKPSESFSGWTVLAISAQDLKQYIPQAWFPQWEEAIPALVPPESYLAQEEPHSLQLMHSALWECPRWFRWVHPHWKDVNGLPYRILENEA